MMEDIERCMKNRKYLLLSSFMNNEVKNITILVNYIGNSNILSSRDIFGIDLDISKYRTEILLSWLYAILSNPFDFKKILDNQSFEKIVEFCMDNVEKYYFQKISIKCIVFLDKENILVSMDSISGQYYFRSKKIREELFYCFLKTYSKYTKIDLELKEWSDSAIILRYKLKIMSYQFKFYDNKKEVIKSFFKHLNSDNVKLGWTLSKCIVRISKYVDINDLVTSLKNECDDVFANESKWIHVLTVLSMLNLINCNIGNVDRLINETIYYDKEFVFRSSTLREHCLFLIWSMVRSSRFRPDNEFKSRVNGTTDAIEIFSSYSIGEIFRIIFFRSLFDSSYSCRRAAISIILEIIGSYKTENGSKILGMINSNSFKRIENGSKIYDAMSTLYKLDYSEYLKEELFHHDASIKKLSATIISKHYTHLDFYKKPANVSDSISLSNLLLALMLNNMNLNKIPGVDVLFEEVITIKLDAKLMRIRNTDLLVEIYLSILNIMYYDRKDIHEYIDKNMLDTIKSNLIFFLTKDIQSYKASRICWKMNDNDLYKRLTTLRNMGGLLVNTRNDYCKDTTYKKIKDNIKQENIELKIKTYKVLKHVEDIGYFQNEIFMGLEEYTLDRRGDVAFEIRYECLLLSRKNPSIFYKYLTRYLVEKNKYLRRYCISLIESIYDIYLDFPHSVTNKMVTAELPYNPTYVGFITSFFRIYTVNLDTLGYEKAYVKAMIKSCHLLDDDLLYNFMIGILSFVTTSDSYITDLAMNLILENLEFFDPVISRIIDDKYFRVYDYILKFTYDTLDNEKLTKKVYKYKQLFENYNELILKKSQDCSNFLSYKKKNNLINERLKMFF